MNVFARGLAAMLTAVIVVAGAAAPTVASAQAASALDTERARVSYMVGHDVARSIEAAGPDIDLAAFESAFRNAFAGGEPLIAESEVPAVGEALMMRIASRAGRAPADAKVPDVDRRKVGHLVGADVGRSLVPIKDELELPVLLQGVRATFAGTGLLMDEAAMSATRAAFGERVRGQMLERARAEGETNRAKGAEFLAANKQNKGVFTTPSGLQYSVLRQGSGPRPTANSRVRVNYEGRLLDGTVFDSSYARGEATEFGLGQVIAGWTEGVAMMPVGAKYRFWIPGDLAYGAKGGGDGKIGPNATLVFDVELQAIVQ